MKRPAAQAAELASARDLASYACNSTTYSSDATFRPLVGFPGLHCMHCRIGSVHEFNKVVFGIVRGDGGEYVEAKQDKIWNVIDPKNGPI